MSKEAVLTRRKGKKKVSVFMCRKGSHEWVPAGKIKSKGATVSFQWCTTCGCLQETNSDDEVAKIKVPDTGI